ncbi:MAG TPA: GNAT family N-acetyltransferase [Candidatus Bathyarchaeia archaeon]
MTENPKKPTMNGLKMVIKRATIADAEEVLSLQKLAYQSEAEIYNSFDIPPLTQTLQEIKDEFSSKTVLKTVFNEKIIGSVRAFLKDGTCYIGRLIVHPNFQNQGIGTKLTNEIERIFSNAKRFELFTGYRSAKNLHLYQKLGYKIFKTEKVNENLKLAYLEKSVKKE